MAAKTFQSWKYRQARSTAGDWEAITVRAMLLMANHTAISDDEAGLDFLSDFGDLDEMDGAGYARLTVSNLVATRDDTNKIIKYLADDLLFPGLSAGTRGVKAVLWFKFVTNDSDSIPIGVSEYSDLQTPTGADFPHNWNSLGLWRSA